MQRRLVQAATQLVDQQRAHQALEQLLAESRSRLGGAARFWASCYEQAMPLEEGATPTVEPRERGDPDCELLMVSDVRRYDMREVPK